METSYSQVIIDFLSETNMLLEHLEELHKDTAIELYELYDVAVRAATLNIAMIDPELRVTLCDRQDAILEQVIDLTEIPPRHINIYTPAVQGFRRWGNVELLKDKGLTGYMLARELGAHPVMLFGTKPEDYPYTALLPGLEVLYTDKKSGNPIAYGEHLLSDYAKMDALILHGMYSNSIAYLDEYRKRCPAAKVYCGLDMNSTWMRYIFWGSPSIEKFAGQCDIVATSCRFLRDELNRNSKVSFPCRWFPNGFYNATNLEVKAGADSKNNVILTVGRIGTVQKNNAELLMAFAKVSEKLTGWTLRLVGSIEPDFMPYIEEYFEKFPRLKDRVIFTGAITDKVELFREYARAKLFAFTSKMEGGPNVYAEALFHGCMFVTSDIDAADDITNFGELGIKYKLGDVDALAGALVKLANNSDIRAFQQHIQKALAYAHKYYDWNRNAKKLAYMLYH